MVRIWRREGAEAWRTLRGNDLTLTKVEVREEIVPSKSYTYKK